MKRGRKEKKTMKRDKRKRNELKKVGRKEKGRRKNEKQYTKEKKGKGMKEIKTVGRKRKIKKNKARRQKEKEKKKMKKKMATTRIQTGDYWISYLLTQRLHNATPHAEFM